MDDHLTVEEVESVFTWPLDLDGSEPLVDEVMVDSDAVRITDEDPLRGTTT